MHHFNCPHCEQHLEAEQEDVGAIVECPNYNTSIEIPIAHPTHPASLPIISKPPPIVKNLANNSVKKIKTNIEITNVNVVDINMSFGNMVCFMVKWAIATIPAIIILIIIGSVMSGIFSGIFLSQIR